MSIKFVHGSSQSMTISAENAVWRNTKIFSISMWYYPQVKDLNYRIIIDDWDYAPAWNICFYFQHMNDNTWQCAFSTDGTVPGISSCNFFGAGDWNINTWYHIFFIADGTNLNCYVDNVFQNQVGIPANIYAGNDPNWYLAYRQDAAGQYISGQILDLRTYNRDLSAAEREIIYEHRGSDNIVNGLVGRYLFNEKESGAVVTSATDYSISKLNGTPANNPTYTESILKITK